MRANLLRPSLSLLLSWSLICSLLPAQNVTPAKQTPFDPQGLVKPDPKKAKKLSEQGAKAEAAGNYEQALALYEEAARYAPFDITIVSKSVTLRSRLVRGYVDAAERLALDADYEGAVLQLAAALHIDAGNTIVQERLKQLQAQGQAKKEVVREEPPIGLPKIEPLKVSRSFNLRADARGAFEQVAAAYGVKASFDPDLPPRSVHLHLDDVDFETAMTVMTAETGTFWRPLNAQLIFIAPDTAQKRKDYDLQMEETFVLPSTVDAADLTELVRVIRDMTGAQHVQQSLPSRSITVRDTVQRVRLAGEILRNLEHGRGEVILEIDLLQVDRNNAIKLGITPPASQQVIPITSGFAQELRSAPSLTALLTLLASVFGGPIGAVAGGSVGSLASSIPAIAAIGGGKTTFLLALPTFSADFSQALSLVQNGQQVLLRAQDGKPATFFVGDRYPITLSYLSGSLGGTNLIPNPSGTGVILPTEQFTVGQSPVALVSADFQNAGTLDLAVLNQTDNSITILLNQGTNATSQFAQASGSPIILGTPSNSSNSQATVSAPATLTVTSATLNSIAVTPATPSIAKGATQQFAATGTFSDGSTQDLTGRVTWSSSASTVASIGATSGLATGLLAGTTQISASLGSISSVAVPLNVTSAILQSIVVTSASPSIAVKTLQQFNATGTFSDGSAENITSTATWTSSNTSTAVIDANSGLATALAAGTSQISTVLGSVSSAAATLQVTTATLKSIAVTPATASIAPEAAQQFVATGTFSDNTTQDITDAVGWNSATPDVATIDPSTGLATAVAAGTTQITATQGGSGLPVALAVGSLNSNTDSLPDLLIASQITNSVMVLTGNGDGTFSNPKTALTYTVGRKPTAVAVGAFNTKTNASLGFVTTNFLDNSFSVFTGNGNGSFTQVKGSPFQLPSGEQGPVAVAVADFNNDGIPDLAIVNQTTNNLSILLGNGDGTFTELAAPKSPISAGKLPAAIASGTLSGSTGPALAIADQQDASGNSAGSVTVLFGNGDGSFTPSSQSPLATTSPPTGVVIGEFLQSTNGIAVTNTSAGTVTVFVDLGSGLLTKALEPAAGTDPGAIVAGNFVGSTFPDVVVANNLPLVSGQTTDGLVTLLISPTSLVSNPALNQQPYPGSEYEDIGLKIKATPTLHANGEVTLQLDFDIKSLAGTSLNGIPVLNNRSLTQTVRLKEDETSLLTGLLGDQTSKTITGIPGLAPLPGIGYAFGVRTNNVQDTELLFLITPRRVRSPVHESRSIYAGRGDASGRGSVGAAAPPETGQPQPPTEQPEPAPVQPPAPEPGPPPVPQPPPGEQTPPNPQPPPPQS